MIILGERTPHGRQIQNEAIHGPFAGHRIEPGSRLGLAVRAVDRHRAVLRVDKPAQSGTVGQVLLQLVSQHLRTIGGGLKFDHKVGAKVPKPFAACGGQFGDAGLRCPRRIGRSAGAIGQDKATRRVRHHAATILPSPTGELATNVAISHASPGIGGWHDDDLSLRRHLKKQIRMLAAKRGELFIGHRMSRQGSGQERIIDHERHAFSVTPPLWAKSANAWGQNDDITVVTVRRVR